jgi:hypothetical protein
MVILVMKNPRKPTVVHLINYCGEQPHPPVYAQSLHSFRTVYELSIYFLFNVY